MNIMVILYDGKSIDGKEGVMHSIATALSNNLGTVNVKFITPEMNDYFENNMEIDQSNQEAIDNAVVLVSELTSLPNVSNIAFAIKLAKVANNNSANILNALWVLKDVERIAEITKEVRDKYQFNKTHLEICKQILADIVK